MRRLLLVLICVVLLATLGVVATAAGFSLDAEDVASFECPVLTTSGHGPHADPPPPPSTGCHIVPFCVEDGPHGRDEKCDGNAGGGND